MVKLKIIEIKEYNNCILEDDNKKIYNVNIKFLGDKVPKVNDYIYIHDKILNEINIYTYGPLNDKYIRYIDKIKQEELIKIVTEIEEYYLQRYYG